MPAETRAESGAVLSEFEIVAREDREFELFHEVLRHFRDVRPASAPAMTRRGLRVLVYTAVCPVDPRHRLTIAQMRGGATYTCRACAASVRRHQRLGDALELLLGYLRWET